MKVFLVLAMALGLLVIFNRDVARNESAQNERANAKPTPIPLKLKGTSLDNPYPCGKKSHGYSGDNSTDFRGTMLDHPNTTSTDGNYVSPLDRRPTRVTSRQ